MVANLDLSILSKKVGPLPVGAWMLAGAGGLYLSRRVRGTTKAASPLGVVSSGLAVDGAAPANGDPAAADSNDAWGRRVLAQLIAEGVEPTAAQRAVTNFLSGYPLTASEQIIVDRALLIAGVPPEGVPPVTVDNGDTSGAAAVATPTASPFGPAQQPAASLLPPIYLSSPNGDPTHDAAIQDPAVSAYLQSLYLQGLATSATQQAAAPASYYPYASAPTGDVAHDTAIQDPAVSSYLQALYLAGQ